MAASPSILAQTKIYSCINKETNFTTTFSVDFSNKSITHLTSQSPNTNQKFTGIGKLTVVTFEKDYSISHSITQEGKILNIILFNFQNDTYSISGHPLTEKKKPHPQLFECSKNS